MIREVASVCSDRWEYGSEFHWLMCTGSASEPLPWAGRSVNYASGRDALRSLLRYGLARRGWRRLWMPTYFCQEVVESLLETGIQILAYPDSPVDDEPDLRNLQPRVGDVLLRVNYFGLRTRSARAFDAGPMEIIENHTHDPWSAWATASDADWCVASLRKTLPIPDGAVLWSPRGHELPSQPPVTDRRAQASLRKLSAMTIKGHYLNGDQVDKEIYRELATAGESEIASGEVSGMTNWSAALLLRFPYSQWRRRRMVNHWTISEALEGLGCVRVLQPQDPEQSCPFSAVLVFDNHELREAVRKRLIDYRVYPAILWQMEGALIDGIPATHFSLSRTLLSIHCDMRYAGGDVLKVAQIIRSACARAGSGGAA